ncbi:unnamed protein product [Didymodactylos carnosus]|uniref:Uncharacterized protein n=1 Tax=Didymodactylos carnosus TaxID=1234261 RepID=A0A814UCP3_9BILA|nr:unnamed protein product [Didymodactylos carnosus]CAF3935718.1 unnamed protein product [Didymodactylos carnosus]
MRPIISSSRVKPGLAKSPALPASTSAEPAQTLPPINQKSSDELERLLQQEKMKTTKLSTELERQKTLIAELKVEFEKGKSPFPLFQIQTEKGESAKRGAKVAPSMANSTTTKVKEQPTSDDEPEEKRWPEKPSRTSNQKNLRPPKDSQLPPWSIVGPTIGQILGASPSY